MELGTHIRRHRQAAGLSLRKLAELVRVNPAYLSRVERGIVPPSETLIQTIAIALRAEPEEFLLLAGRMPAHWQQAIAASPGRVIETFRKVVVDCVAESTTPYSRTVLAFGGTRAIEEASFPFEHLSDIAELESWRKEIYRPTYHLHKWWAQRLGSVFRAILLASFAPKGSNVLEMFYQPARLPGAVIFDPFMGSGTTMGETLKLGARAIGRDINPVAHFMVRNALSVHSRRKIIETFRAIEQDVAPQLRHFYRTPLPEGALADVLYYFWVKVVPCPACERPVDLFSSYIFARHVYPTRNPEARAVCPYCGMINTLRYDTEHAICTSCQRAFNPKAGPANGAKAVCSDCGHVFPIAKTVQQRGEPPAHRLYAKLVLRPNGVKEYHPTDAADLALYAEACQALQQRQNAYPLVTIVPGYNTNQVLNYCYIHWYQMFNARQLLCLSLLAERIRAIPHAGLRDLFACLFSGTLEFNNMFASFKGEGTGAVRHMFSHHILKPERMPLEANLWGTPKSSGSFSTLFESRLLPALDYCEKPFELRVIRKHGKITGEKVYGLSPALGYDVTKTWAEFQAGRQLYLSCGDSAHTDLAPESVDAVITDPPFFDNVHYSQLADFFYVWQRHVLGENGDYKAHSTRAVAEIQHSDPATFTARLCGVWTECYRVLRSDGLLVFTYHHSRAEGWRCVLAALVEAGFGIVATHPIKAEMSVAAPKQQAKEPIDLDIILVCRKREAMVRDTPASALLIDDTAQEAAAQMTRLNHSGRSLSRNDVRVIFMAQIIKRLSWKTALDESLPDLDTNQSVIENALDYLYRCQQVAEPSLATHETQLTLW
jgi:adenine-specific DNA methylase/DNA-binding XRE family transcriptional regulator